MLSSYISEQDKHATLELRLADTIISGLLTDSISVPSIRGNSVADCTGPTFVIYFMSLSVETTEIGANQSSNIIWNVIIKISCCLSACTDYKNLTLLLLYRLAGWCTGLPWCCHCSNLCCQARLECLQPV